MAIAKNHENTPGLPNCSPRTKPSPPQQAKRSQNRPTRSEFLTHLSRAGKECESGLPRRALENELQGAKERVHPKNHCVDSPP